MNTASTLNDQHARVGVLERAAFGSGDLACNLVFASVTSFLLYFYTDVFGIGAAAAGLVLLVARVWDAFWDLGVGALVDRTRSARGQLRPWLMLGAPLLAVLMVACFTVPSLPPTAKVAYAAVTYILLMSAYSIVNIPYAALPTAMTSDVDQRNRLAGWRSFFAFGGTLGVGALTQPLVQAFGAGDAAQGFQRVAMLYAVLAAGLLMFCGWRCRERVPVPPLSAGRTLVADFRVLAADRAWRVLALSGLIAFSVLIMPLVNAVYFMIYVVKRPDLVPVYFLLSGGGTMLAAVISNLLVRFICKRRLILFSTALSSLLLGGFYWVDVTSLPVLFGAVLAIGVCMGISIPITFAMAADVVDHVDRHAGRRLPGLVFSAMSFVNKAGLGLSGALSGLVLASFGYVSNMAQTPDALHGIRLCMSLIPALGGLGVFLVLLAYPLRQPVVLETSRVLADRRRAPPEAAA